MQDALPARPSALYDHAWQLFQHGHLKESQDEADRGYRRYLIAEPAWASRFRLLEAESMVWRGANQNALELLGGKYPSPDGPEATIEKLTLKGIAFTYLQRFSAANEVLAHAESLCVPATRAACGGVLRARGILALETRKLEQARQFFLASLTFARVHQDMGLESSALLNLGWVSLQDEHYDEAVDWSTSAYRAALGLGDENRVQGVLGNLGWAYFELGDKERALELFLDAQKRAARVGNMRQELKWLTASGLIYQDTGDLARATQAYNRALSLATQIESQEDIVNSLESLAHVSIEAGRLSDADKYLQKLDPLIRASGNRLDALDVMLAQGRLAVARHQDQQGESLFHLVDGDSSSQVSMRLGAEHELARLFETQGRLGEAESMYAKALTTFESQRAQLKNEDSKLPFFANATPIYDDYIHLLVTQGKAAQALAIADQSRARTLAQGLGLTTGHASARPALFRPESIAGKTKTTLLFYWLGKRQSYLWVITAKKTYLYPLAAISELLPLTERYRKALQGPDDPLRSLNPDGLALYQQLVAPARNLLPPDAHVAILTDGLLSELNFETLLVPGITPHYWIEDANIVSSPSLHMLASAMPARHSGRNLLLLGDAISPGPDYPQLPNAASEIRQIRKHFDPGDQTILTREQATSSAYLGSQPQQFAYIDFVAHGVASPTDPLDSAIILSNASGAEDAFKLHARQIILHPIDARLVTIAACYGGGTRSYAGEGLVGLSWAFLRAGAHNVIGALWEVSDNSTPLLMDHLYQGLEKGMEPGEALRQAKLSLLHSRTGLSRPFFWAPFQLYTGL